MDWVFGGEVRLCPVQTPLSFEGVPELAMVCRIVICGALGPDKIGCVGVIWPDDVLDVDCGLAPTVCHGDAGTAAGDAAEVLRTGSLFIPS